MVLFQISVIHKHNLYRNEGINIMKKPFPRLKHRIMLK